MSGVAAIVPAAGLSTRMGRPKLLLPVGGEPLIVRVVNALRAGGAAPVVVVAPPRSQEGAAEIIDAAGRAGALVLVAQTPPPDMRASIELGLNLLVSTESTSTISAPATLLIAPGDSPGLSAALVALVLDAVRRTPASIIVPVFEGKRGHPIAIPASAAESVRDLPPGKGLNALLDEGQFAIVDLETRVTGTLADLDTPEDYRRWQRSESGALPHADDETID